MRCVEKKVKSSSFIKNIKKKQREKNKTRVEKGEAPIGQIQFECEAITNALNHITNLNIITKLIFTFLVDFKTYNTSCNVWLLKTQFQSLILVMCQHLQHIHLSFLLVSLINFFIRSNIYLM